MGICVYPSSEQVPAKTLQLAPPAPATSHYEKPPCQSDETEASVQGANGEVCAPKCDASGTCPTDVPPGTKATPKCALQDQSGNKYCALMCLRSAGCPSGATCAKVGGLFGICVYPESKSRPTPSTELHLRHIA